LGRVNPQLGNINHTVGAYHPPPTVREYHTPQLGRINPQLGRINPQIGNINHTVGAYQPHSWGVSTLQLGRINPQLGNINPTVEEYQLTVASIVLCICLPSPVWEHMLA
jgi:hypothetical protein